MAITSRKITTYTANIADLSDAPNKDGITADQLKALFDGRTDTEIKNSINGIVDDLVAVTDGASGADQIGMTPIKEGGADKVQTVIEELKVDVAANLGGHTSRTDNPHAVTKTQVGLGNLDDAKQATKAEFDVHTARTDNPHAVTPSQLSVYTKAEMQTSGSASLHWGNLTNVPNMADKSWKSAVATPANLPVSGNTLGDQRVVLNDGDGKQAMYVCVATSGDFNAQWDKIGDVDWTNDHGNMVGLGDDDHTQYHNDTRGDIRYYPKADVDDLLHNRAGAVIKELEIVSSAGQTAYDISATGTYTVGDFTMEVFKKGVTGRYEKLDKDDYVETSGTVVTLTTASSVGDVYLFRWFENTPELISSYAQKNGEVQTNLNADLLDGQHGSYYAPVNNPTLTGTVVLPATTSIGTIDSTELSKLNGCAVNIQDQFNISVTYDGYEDLTNKRITKRVTSIASGTPAPSATFDDEYHVTALAANVTVSAPTGTPTSGQPLMLRFKDNGTGRTLGWNAIYRAIGVTLPTTTVAGKTLYVGCKYNTADSKWDVLAVGQEV